MNTPAGAAMPFRARMSTSVRCARSPKPPARSAQCVCVVCSTHVRYIVCRVRAA
jgi:hypothetical protein